MLDYARRLRGNSLIQTVYNLSPRFIHNFIYSVYGLAKLLEYHTIVKKYLRQYETEEHKTTLDIKNAQVQRLKFLLDKAQKETPYYNNLFVDLNIRVEDINSIEDLKKIPELTKDILSENYEGLISAKYKEYVPKKMSSGGTTGTTATFLLDKETHYRKEAQAYHYWNRHGFDIGRDKTIMYRAGVLIPNGAPIIKPWRLDYARKMAYFSSYYGSNDLYEGYYQFLTLWQPKYMHFLPSAVYLFAQFLNERNRVIPLKKAFSASEMLYDFQKEAIERAFDCKVIDHYGHIEPGNYVAGQCVNGNYHTCSSDVITEVLEDGSILETSLNNFSMPFIRYRIGDRADGIYFDCDCGIKTPYIKNIQGRDSEVVQTADGRTISSIGFDQIFRNNNVKLGQIEQLDEGNFRLNLVVSEDYTTYDESSMSAELHARVGFDSRITLNYVKDIPKAVSGKYRMVIVNKKSYRDGV